jgi:hypothetical protein
MLPLSKRIGFTLLGLSCLGILAKVALAQTQSAYFTLGTASSVPTVGRSFTLPIIVDTGDENVAGADAVIRYNPQTLSVVRVDPGEIFDNYPRHTFDQAGNIEISGAMSETIASFSGRGTFGVITLRGAQAGSTTISFSCTPGQANDSNILQAITNIDIIDCDRTEPTTFLVAAAPTPVGLPTASPTASPAPIGTAGSAELTLILAGLGLLLITFGGFLKWSQQT